MIYWRNLGGGLTSHLGLTFYVGLKNFWKIAELIDYCYVRSKSAHFNFWLDLYMVHFYSANKKSCFFRGKMAFSSKTGSFGGAGICPKIPKKWQVFGFKNDTKPLLLPEIELRRCIYVEHIPGSQNNTLETILELLLAPVGRFLKKSPKSPMLAHFWSFLANSATCEPWFVCKTP